MKGLALIAHDNQKPNMVNWAKSNIEILKRFKLYGTGTTGRLVQDQSGLEVECFLSGPLGGDAQIGALVATGHINAVIFFVDPLTSMPHDPDVRMLLRICNVHNVPLATNPATAELIIDSPIFQKG
ncbi:MAG: Methylglyoxal synthase [Chloroflexi bacterium]|jgi:methylglyoxal synthase|nr:Methylglyoxal synthase [Chloroflexota bacterium]